MTNAMSEDAMIPRWYEDTPEGRELKARRLAELAVQRREAVEKIAALENEKQRELPRLREKVGIAQEESKMAKEALLEAEDRARLAQGELLRKRDGFDRSIAKETEFLISTCNPAVEESIQFFRERLDWLRDPRRINRQPAAKTGVNLVTMQKQVTTASNLPSIEAALTHCMGAITELESMRLKADFDADRVAELKAGIPDIETLIEFSAEKALPRGPGDNHASRSWARRLGIGGKR